MKKNRLFALLLALLLMLTTAVIPAAAAETDHPWGTEYHPETAFVDEETAEGAENSAAAYTTDAGLSIGSKSAILVDEDTGDILYAYNAEETFYPLSTIKLMTAYLCMKYGNLNDTAAATSEALAGLYNATTMGMYVGEKFTIYQLMVGMLLPSGCDAANVIGEYISGSMSAFVELMNQEAAALGCTNTHFVNCHGYPNADQYSTVVDMAIIARAALQYDTVREIVGSYKITIGATNMRGARTFTNPNMLLPASGSSYAYPYATGLKTGSGSGSYPLAFSAEKDGVRLVGVILGVPSMQVRWSDAAKILDWGFENYNPNRMSSSRCQVSLDQTSYTYDGDTHHPEVTVTFDGKTLTQGTDYTVSYSGGQMIGTATVTVTGTGSYTGSRQVTYQIFSPMPFTDVMPTAWYWDDVLSGWKVGLVSGMTPTTYEPQRSTTRGMAVTMLHRFYGSPETEGGTTFTDLTQEYYVEPIIWAQSNGIVYGRTETTFAPDDNISRQDFVTILYRLEQEPETDYDLSAFEDADQIADYAQDAFRWALTRGIVYGRGDNELAPRADITRAEIIAILMRYWNLKQAQG